MDRLSELNRELYSAHTGVGFGVIASSKQTVVPTVGGWVELGRTTLGSTSSTVTVSSLPNKRYYQFIWFPISFPVGNEAHIRMGNSTIDTASNYADRVQPNGTADVTGINQIGIDINNNFANTGSFGVGYIANLASKEKLLIAHSIEQGAAGAGNAPFRQESVGKWTNASDLIDVLQLRASAGASMGVGSQLIINGWDPADVHTDNFWEELASVDLGSSNANISSGTITAKKYLWIQAYVKKTATLSTLLTFNNDTAMSYGERWSANGASDNTSVNRSNIDITAGISSATPHFYNIFVVNNSATEKLLIENAVDQNTAGAANAPARTEIVGKWTNTSAQITEIDLTTSTSTFASGSKLRVWGSN